MPKTWLADYRHARGCLIDYRVHLTTNHCCLTSTSFNWCKGGGRYKSGWQRMVDIQIHCERSSLPKTRAWLLGFLNIYSSAFVVLTEQATCVRGKHYQYDLLHYPWGLRCGHMLHVSVLRTCVHADTHVYLYAQASNCNRRKAIKLNAKVLITNHMASCPCYLKASLSVATVQAIHAWSLWKLSGFNVRTVSWFQN